MGERKQRTDIGITSGGGASKGIAFSRRALIAGGGIAAAAAVSDAVARPSSPLGVGMRSALSAIGISTYSMGRFEEFSPDNPKVKPSELAVPMGVNGTSSHPTGWWHSAGRATHTSWTPTYDDVFHRGTKHSSF